ncbi:MAG: hypothetical protein ABS76_07850 [Pelagibacterium sp. SCN 64-44]|nr:MAG: hypothetical protein ABS76_07850 [Pelagibacterium sp. SCN 64-44]
MGANIQLVSNHYSAERFVPHFQFTGPVLDGDAATLSYLFDQLVECDVQALPAEGGNCAVVSLHSPGGNYIEGLRLARLLRERAVATVVRANSECYSACAFAFLGGSGYSSQAGVGAYNDRFIEPRGILGFHAPYFAPDNLGTLVAEHGMDTVLGASRDDIALMVQRLVEWNVDSNILGYVVSMGPDETYDVTSGEDYYLTRAHLPPSPLGHWFGDKQTAIRNACLRLLAHHRNSFLDEAPDAVGAEFLQDLVTNETGQSLSGFRIGPDNPLGVTYCALPAGQADLQGDVDLSLFTAPGVSGAARPMLTLFHRPDGWSSLGTGSQADRRLFKKGGFNAMFTAPFGSLADRATDALDYLDFQRFDNFNPQFPVGSDLPRPQTNLPLALIGSTHSSDIFEYGDHRIVVQIGNPLLLDVGKTLLPVRNVTIELNSATDLGFVYAGTYPSGRPFVWFSLSAYDDGLAALVEIEAKSVPLDLDAAIAEQYAIGCSFSFLGSDLTCQ